MRTVKTTTLGTFIDYSKINDDIIKNVMKNLSELLIKAHRNIYDDFISFQNIDRVDSLPTAKEEYRGRLLILKGVGTGADTLYLGINTGSGGYGFKQITLT